jgi:hypothetical protein
MLGGYAAAYVAAWAQMLVPFHFNKVNTYPSRIYLPCLSVAVHQRSAHEPYLQYVQGYTSQHTQMLVPFHFNKVRRDMSHIYNMRVHRCTGQNKLNFLLF